MELFWVAITILAAILTYHTWKNGKWMKQAHQDTLMIFERMERRAGESHQNTISILEKMEKSHEETIKFLAQLIISEGEKTRQAIKEERQAKQYYQLAHSS